MTNIFRLNENHEIKKPYTVKRKLNESTIISIDKGKCSSIYSKNFDTVLLEENKQKNKTNIVRYVSSLLKVDKHIVTIDF